MCIRDSPGGGAFFGRGSKGFDGTGGKGGGRSNACSNGGGAVSYTNLTPPTSGLG